MNRQPIIEAFARVETLATEIRTNIPAASPRLSDFRADLAGLLNVTICATYENCVKVIIHDYAARQSQLFERYTRSQYDKINSRIDLSDLHKLAKTFHNKINLKFKEDINRYKKYYLDRANEDITTSYSQILKWRHDFAHSGTRVTTVEEVLKYHQIGKRVILLFSDAFAQELR